MNNPRDKFQQGYSEGRSETREILDGKEMSDDYSFKLAKPIVYFSIIVGIISFFYFWLFTKINLFPSALFAFLVFSALVIVLGMLIGSLILLIRKTRKNKE